jgi:CubicO group peptidase (beta-lactamase class C family)
MRRSVLDPAAVDAVFARFWASSPAPGLAYGVVADGELVHFGGLGGLTVGGPVPTPDSVFRIASMTKSFTAAALLSVRDEGRLALDDPAATYVPGLADLRGPTSDSPAVTLRHLATMSAGFPTDDPWGDRQLRLLPGEFDAILARGLSFARAPGIAFEYSNLSYALLGRAIAAAAGEPYADVVAARLLRPLGLSSTFFEARAPDRVRLAVGHRRRFTVGAAAGDVWVALPFAGHGQFAAMGGLYSSVADLARWIGELTDAFPARDGDEVGHPLSRASRRELQQDQRRIPPAPVGPGGVLVGGYGLGLGVAHDPDRGDLVGHPGGLPGFGSAMRWHPATGVGVVALLNSTYAAAEVPVMEALDALVRVETSGLVEEVWPETLGARDDVVRLLADWDDALAARLFAACVDQDRPLELRRAEIARLRERLGTLSLDEATPATSVSPAQLSWWMKGPGGRLKVAISLSPESPPAVQMLELTPSAGPPAG